MSTKPESASSLSNRENSSGHPRARRAAGKDHREGAGFQSRVQWARGRDPPSEEAGERAVMVAMVDTTTDTLEKDTSPDSDLRDTDDVDGGASTVPHDTEDVDAGAPIVPDCSGVLEFPDSELERVVRYEIDKPNGDILPSDVVGLTRLGGFEYGLRDLTGIQCLTDRTDLNFFFVMLDDIGPLAALTHLTYLNLYLNHVRDLGPLAELSSLTTLILTDNNLTDIAPLSGLTGLESLQLDINKTSFSLLSVIISYLIQERGEAYPAFILTTDNKIIIKDLLKKEFFNFCI